MSLEELVLGSFFWDTMRDRSYTPSIDGRWVVWSGYTSPITPFTSGEKAAYAYDLETRELIPLENRMGTSQESPRPQRLRGLDGLDRSEGERPTWICDASG